MNGCSGVPYSIDALLFDLDGTLADTACGIVDASQHLLREYGLPEKKPQEILSYVGAGLVDLVSKTVEVFDPQEIKSAISVYTDYYAQHGISSSPLFPGVRDVLRDFSHKQLVIVSNKNRESIIALLEYHGLTEFFACVHGGDDPELRKPNARVIEYVAQVTGCSPEKMIMIGDMGVDVQTGKSAGVLTAAAVYGIGDRESLMALNPDIVLESIEDLRQYIV